MVDTFLLLNGVYDVACWACILTDTPVISSLHIGLLGAKHDDNTHNLAARRVLADWILTYGLIRIMAGAHKGNIPMRTCAILTYLVEGFAWGCIAMVPVSGEFFVSLSCFIIAGCLHVC